MMPTEETQVINYGYEILKKGQDILSTKFSEDEQFPDLFDQFAFRPEIEGCHKYFLEPCCFSLNSGLEQEQFVDIPSSIQHHRSRAKCASFMGLFPEIHRAWITVDNVLYLWNYFQPDDIEIYDGASEVITSLALSTPKAGIFSLNVQYVVILATSVEASILALCGGFESNMMKIVPTSFTLSVNSMAVIKLIGSQSGRIFMICNDLSLYEIEYSYVDNALSAIIGGSPKPLCKRIQHFVCNGKMNEIFRPFLSHLFPPNDVFSDMCFDNSRNVLYCITVRGLLYSMYLGENGTQSFRFVNGFDILAEAKNFLATLKAAGESSPKVIRFNDLNSAEFDVVSIHPIFLTESVKTHAVILLASGIRIYIGITGKNGNYFSFKQSEIFHPCGVEIQAIRSPPSVEAIQKSKLDLNLNASKVGTFPNFTTSQSMKFGVGYHAHGINFVTVETDGKENDLFCFYEDIIQRGHSESVTSRVCMKETIHFFSAFDRGTIYDIKENTSILSDQSIRDLLKQFCSSCSPKNSGITDNSNAEIDCNHYNAPFYSNYIGPAGDCFRNCCKDTSIIGEISLQHVPVKGIPLQRRFFVLTDCGIVVIKKIRPCDALQRIISAHTLDMNLVQDFFCSFGMGSASVMCVGLAIGLPCDAGSFCSVGHVQSNFEEALTDTVTLRSMDILLKYSQLLPYHELLSRKVDIGQCCSLVNHAIYAIFSRLVRPIWNIPCKLFNLSIFFVAGAQVKDYLQKLKDLIYGYFSSIIRSDHAVDDIIKFTSHSTDFVTAGILKNNARTIYEDRFGGLDNNFEDLQIRSLYFLCARTLQSILLLEIYYDIANKFKMEFDGLGALTINSIVVEKTSRQSINSFHRKMFAILIKHGDKNLFNDVCNKLSNGAYYFFPSKERYFYEAANTLNQICNQPIMARNFEALKDIPKEIFLSINYYLSASNGWTTKEFVLGETCELQIACQSLKSCGDIGWEAIVALCLRTVRNFVPEGMVNETSFVKVPVLNNLFVPALHWDSDCFEDKRNFPEDFSEICAIACYDYLIQTIVCQLSSVNPQDHVIGNKMLMIASSACSDERFHRNLYCQLYLGKHFDSLMVIESGFIEEYLRLSDISLLFDYYRFNVDGRTRSNLKAFQLMCDLGTSSTDVEINVRLSHLRKAVMCLKDALQSDTERLTFDTSSAAEKIKELQLAINIAEYQKLVHEKLKERYSQFKLNKEMEFLENTDQWLHKLKFHLIDTSTLFNDICLCYSIWDICICILQATNVENNELVSSLWVAYIHSLVPTSSTNKQIKQYLLLSKANSLKQLPIGLSYNMYEVCGDSSSFESGCWVQPLLESLKQLGKSLNAAQFTAYFPLRNIVVDLEELMTNLSISSNISIEQCKQQVLSLFRELGISWDVLLDVYLSMLTQSSKRTALEQLHVIGSIVIALKCWLHQTIKFLNRSESDGCLARIKSGDIRKWLENIERYVNILDEHCCDKKLESLKEFIGLEINSCSRIVSDLNVSI